MLSEIESNEVVNKFVEELTTEQANKILEGTTNISYSLNRFADSLNLSGNYFKKNLTNKAMIGHMILHKANNYTLRK